MKANITQALVEEHRVILRMIALLERNASRAVEGSYRNWQFFLDGVDFIRNYADRFHHAKEEDVLFEALVASGMPRQHSPVAAMKMEHEQGRGFVRNLEAAANEAMAGKNDRLPVIVANALAYGGLLREHIAKEDDILYPLAERLVAETARETILEGYQAAEERISADFAERYRLLVEKYEQEP